jgi:hypothetical protein
MTFRGHEGLCPQGGAFARDERSPAGPGVNDPDRRNGPDSARLPEPVSQRHDARTCSTLNFNDGLSVAHEL